MLHVLGQCLIRTSVATIAPRAELGFALATRLIADRGRRLSRRYLTALFWPDVQEQKTAHSLSEALHRLRARGLPIQTDATQAVWLERDAATLDVDRIPEMSTAQLVKCDFTVLPGFEPRGTPALLDWADEFRHQLTIQTVRNLAPAIARAESDGDWASALTLAEHALKLDSEDATALDARARAAESLRGRVTPRNAQQTRSPAVTRRVRESPLPSCAPVSHRPRPNESSGIFVGRASELAILSDAWERTVTGSGRCISISGPSGIGKSRLVREFCGIARADGVVADAACDPPDQRRPMSALIRLVSRLRRLPGAAGCAPESVPYLDRLTEYDDSLGQLPSVGDLPLLAACIEAAIEELIDAVCDEQPLLIAIDNVQWMDSESARFFRGLSVRAKARSALVILTWCESSSTLADRACADAIPIYLGPLSDDAARHLIAHLTAERAPDALIDWFIRAGEGHPFWLSELVQHWKSTNAAFTVPPTLTALLRERIVGLSSLEQHVLQTVALLGHGATIERVERVTSADPHELLNAFDVLGKSGLLVVQTTVADGAPDVACRHDAIAEAALAQIAEPAQALIHRRIACVLDEDAMKSASTDLLWDRATHWTAGNRADRFVQTGIACVHHLADIGLPDAAVAASRDLISRCGTSSDAALVYKVLIGILHLTRRWAEFEAAVNRLERLSGTDDDVELLKLDADWQRRHDPRATLASALMCVNSDLASDDHRIRAAVLALKLATNLGDAQTVERAHSAVGAILPADDVASLDALTFKMIHASVAGCSKSSLAYARVLLERARKPGCVERLRLMLNCASAFGRGGAVDEAQDVCEEVYSLAPKSGLPGISLDACRRAALIMLDHGRFGDAKRWVDRISREPHTSIQPAQQRAIDVMRAKLALSDGNCSDAIALLGQRSTASDSARIPMLDAAVLAVRLLADVAQQEDVAAVTPYVESLGELWKRLVRLGGQDYETVALVAGLRHIGRGSQARATLDRYLTSRRRDAYPFPTALASLLDGPAPRAKG